MNIEINNDPYSHDEGGQRIQKHFLKFLVDLDRDGVKIYQEAAKQMIQEKLTTFEVDYNHFSGETWSNMIIVSYCKYEPYLKKAIYELLQRVREGDEIMANCVYFLKILNFPKNKNLRQLRTEILGQLTSFEGTITRSTEVRPELISGAFKCQLCDTLKMGVEQQFKYTEPKFCEKAGCDNKNQWELNIVHSSFADFQKLRVQEDSADIPPGGMPRSIDTVVRDQIVDYAKPGDKCLFTGYLAVVPDVYALSKPGEQQTIQTKGTDGYKPQNTVTTDGITGLKQLGQRDLNYKLIFICNSVQPIHDRFNQNNMEEDEFDEYMYENHDFRSEGGLSRYYREKWEQMFSEEQIQEVNKMKSNDEEIYKSLANSIAPSVCGHEEIKKGILLMMLGGVHKKTHEQINLRGDINICIVGDPSTAKSQFLKWTAQFLPRSVYTSGKASSAAGLTASVTRDPDTGEYCIQTGALMLADHGVCCIDEFDKMDPKDQVAIHEAMEQQTISITKAGIQATLNARASILAASNPISGRYDKSKSLKNNLEITAPIMSRFDLFFVVLDEMTQYMDEKIAQYILDLHKELENAYKETVKYNDSELGLYIRMARTIKPQFTEEAAQQLHKEYVKLRMNDLTQQKTSYRITVRQLESLVRLSEARAKVELSQTIKREYVIEASRLLSNSILKIEQPDQEFDFENDQSFQSGQQMSQEQRSNDNQRANQQNLVQQDLQQEQRQDQQQARLRITAEEYNAIGRKIIAYIRRQEQQIEEEQRDEVGVLQSDIVSDYLQSNIDRIQSEQDAANLTKICNYTIKQMINKERVLIITRDSNIPGDRRVTVHGNYTDGNDQI